MNIRKLIAELADDPLGRGYAGMTDQEVADSLTAADRQVYVDVTVAALAGACDLHGITPKLEAAPTHPQARGPEVRA